MHAHEAGGINTGALLLALPLLVLGVILFVQKSAAPPVGLVLIAAGIVVSIGSFTFLTTDAPEHPHAGALDTERSYRDSVQALCEASRAEPDAAAALFVDRVHGPLHVLADEIASEDRAVAARLLEAKQSVESALEPETGRARLRAELDRLIDATVAALSVVDLEVEACV